jgi:hypothetical protein
MLVNRTAQKATAAAGNRFTDRTDPDGPYAALLVGVGAGGSLAADASLWPAAATWITRDLIRAGIIRT